MRIVWVAVALAAWGCGGSVEAGGSAGTDGGTGGSAGSPACGPGETLCSAGVCSNLQVDPYNCGACSMKCGPTMVCLHGACQNQPGCQPGLALCNGACVNLQSDPANCGKCALSCGPGGVCSSGQCGKPCPAPLTLCPGGCVDLQSDPMNCGTCAMPCGADGKCIAGKCVSSCQPPYVMCGDNCVDVQSDPNNCGTCGLACPGGVGCKSGVCGACTLVNVALLGKPSISSGGTQEPYVPARANDAILQSQNCNDWAWIDGQDKPMGGWIQYEWPSPVPISSLHMDTESSMVVSACGKIGRTLGGATVQWWNGAAWITDGIVGPAVDDWDYKLSQPIQTTRLRLYDVYATGNNGNAYNPIVFEWQVFGCK